MSFDDSDLYNGFSVGYDQFPSYVDHDTDESLLYSNRANKTGEIDDTLYPISNMRGGYEIEGSGPRISYPTQREQPFLPREPQTSYMTIGDMLSKKSQKSEPFQEPKLKQKRKKEKFIVSSQNFLLILIIALICIVFLQHMQTSKLMNLIQSMMQNMLISQKQK
jgi:hypothetical protein